MNGEKLVLRYPHESPPEVGKAIQIADRIFWIRVPLPMVLDHVNCYALDDGEGWTIVDTGFDSKEIRAIWKTLLDGPLSGKPVHRLIVTHHHPDHIGLAGWFQTEHGAELVITRTAWLTARMFALDKHLAPTNETLSHWRSAGMDAQIYATRSAERPFNFSDVVTALPLGFRRIKEGDNVSAAGRNWQVRIGNGHAPEHATLWSDDGEVVIGGDQLLPSISPNIGVYATEPEADPVADWLESCERLIPFSTDKQLVLPGHKLPFTGLPVRLHQLIDNHHGGLKRLLAHLSEPKTAAECFTPLFKRKIDEKVYGLALVEAMAHLNHLHQQDVISRFPRDDGAWLFQRKG